MREPESPDRQPRDGRHRDHGDRRHEERRPAFEGATGAAAEEEAPLRLRGLAGDALGAGEVGCGGVRVEGCGAAAGELQVVGGRLGEFVLELEEAGGAGHLEGGAVVKGQHLGHVLGAAGGPVLEPAGEAGVLGGSLCERQPRIGTSQRVDEGELASPSIDEGVLGDDSATKPIRPS